jgi:Xaa-Pro aminopeptidase
MVVTIEPGVYFAGRFGIRIEDTVLINKKGRKVLTK